MFRKDIAFFSTMRFKSCMRYIICMLIFDCHILSCLRNFALNKPADQSSTEFYNKFFWTADKAVDGNIDGSNPDTSRTCSETAMRMGNHTWEVDIGFMFIVHQVVIYERSDGQDQLSGFLVILGNHSNPWRTNMALQKLYSKYKHVLYAGDTLARFVSVIRQNKETMTLCEVEVYGECLDGMYSEFCNRTCGQCSNGEPCNKDTGVCRSGCEPGWTGLLCNKEYLDGMYSEFCNRTCGQWYNLNPCNKDTGYCLLGCEPGWTGLLCEKKCARGTYGSGCMFTCGQCLNGNKTCSATDGRCSMGCREGWKGHNCTKKCEWGTYGINCTFTSGQRLNGNETCSATDGRCSMGCGDEWQGDTCKTKCAGGTYGSGCTNTCGQCLNGNETCSATDGRCSMGCSEGWKGHNCKTKCAGGTYGSGCTNTCGQCLNGNETCSATDGRCSMGCSEGWKGHNCKTKCAGGTYGSGCTNTCGQCLNGNETCSATDGRCSMGCRGGWQGDTCTINSSAKLTITLSREDMTVIGGSVVGVCVGALIISIIIIAVFKKERNTDTGDSEMEMSETDVNRKKTFGDNAAKEIMSPSYCNVALLSISTATASRDDAVAQITESEYEKLQDRGRIESSIYCRINGTETDDTNYYNEDGLHI